VVTAVAIARQVGLLLLDGGCGRPRATLRGRSSAAPARGRRMRHEARRGEGGRASPPSSRSAFTEPQSSLYKGGKGSRLPEAAAPEQRERHVPPVQHGRHPRRRALEVGARALEMLPPQRLLMHPVRPSVPGPRHNPPRGTPLLPTPSRFTGASGYEEPQGGGAAVRGAHSFSRLSAATASSAAERRARFARSCSRSASSASTSRCRAPTWSEGLGALRGSAKDF
jgi:hypothetical protein